VRNGYDRTRISIPARSGRRITPRRRSLAEHPRDPRRGHQHRDVRAVGAERAQVAVDPRDLAAQAWIIVTAARTPSRQGVREVKTREQLADGRIARGQLKQELEPPRRAPGRRSALAPNASWRRPRPPGSCRSARPRERATPGKQPRPHSLLRVCREPTKITGPSQYSDETPRPLAFCPQHHIFSIGDDQRDDPLREAPRQTCACASERPRRAHIDLSVAARRGIPNYAHSAWTAERPTTRPSARRRRTSLPACARKTADRALRQRGGAHGLQGVPDQWFPEAS